jgi:hypothetical protein
MRQTAREHREEVMQAAKKRGADQRQAVACVLGLGVAIGMCTTVSALAAEKVGYSAPFLTDPFQADPQRSENAEAANSHFPVRIPMPSGLAQ